MNIEIFIIYASEKARKKYFILQHLRSYFQKNSTQFD